MAHFVLIRVKVTAGSKYKPRESCDKICKLLTLLSSLKIRFIVRTGERDLWKILTSFSGSNLVNIIHSRKKLEQQYAQEVKRSTGSLKKSKELNDFEIFWQYGQHDRVRRVAQTETQKLLESATGSALNFEFAFS